MQHTDGKMQRQVLSVDFLSWRWMSSGLFFCQTQCASRRKCLNTGLIVGPSKQLIMGEKDDEGRSIGVMHSNVQETFELSSLKRYSWTGYVSSVNRKNGERWKDLNVSFICADMGHKFLKNIYKLSFKDVLFCVGFTLQDIPGCCACNVDGKVEKLWNYFCFCWLVIIVFFQNIPDSQLLSQQATRWAHATDEFHGHVLLSPRGTKKTQVQPPRRLETRMSHHQDDRFCRLMAFDPFSASRQANLSVHCWVKGLGGEQRGLLLRVMQLDSRSHGHKMLRKTTCYFTKGAPCSVARVRPFPFGK